MDEKLELEFVRASRDKCLTRIKELTGDVDRLQALLGESCRVIRDLCGDLEEAYQGEPAGGPHCARAHEIAVRIECGEGIEIPGAEDRP